VSSPVASGSNGEPTTVRGVLWWVVRDPWAALGRRWNYKSALLSSLTRGGVFFSVNLSAGWDAAVAALVVECVLRAGTAGFYGALTQAFRQVQPARAGTLAGMIVLPVVGHSLELLVHWLCGTERLAASIVASAAFTAASTAFHLFAMRRGVFTVGHDSASLSDDLRRVPLLVASFVLTGVRSVALTAARVLEGVR